MKITILGSTGMIGRHLVEEAVRRHHQVSAVMRDEGKKSQLHSDVEPVFFDIEKDAQLSNVFQESDVIISAVRPAPGEEAKLPVLTKAVLDAAKRADVRSIIIGGAARLALSDDSEHTVLSAPGFLPGSIRAIAEACMRQFELCQQANFEEWTYFSPPAEFTDGPRTGNYRLGRDTLITDENGRSKISLADFAVAVLDHAEQSTAGVRRLTAAY